MQTSAIQKIREVCPPNSINIADGRVVKLTEWVLWNGVPWETVVIERRKSDFLCASGSPHGGSTVRGTLDEVIKYFHPEIRERYRKLFMFDEPAGAQLKELGFI